MKRTIEFFLQEPKEGRGPNNRISKVLMDGLISKFPDFGTRGYFGGSFKVREPEDSPHLKEVIAELWRLGKRPVLLGYVGDGGTLNGDSYWVRGYVKPAEEELDAADYLAFGGAPENGFGEFSRDVREDESIFWFLNPDNLKLSKRFGYLNSHVSGCSDAFRAKLEAQGFVGLDFVPPPLHPNPNKRPKENVHILSSSIELPDQAPGLPPDEGYTPRLLRYDREVFAKACPFDIARTREHMPNTPDFPPFPALVVSQRFRQWLLREGFEKGDHWPLFRLDYDLIDWVLPGDPLPEPPLAALCRELGIPPPNRAS